MEHLRRSRPSGRPETGAGHRLRRAARYHFRSSRSPDSACWRGPPKTFVVAGARRAGERWISRRDRSAAGTRTAARSLRPAGGVQSRLPLRPGWASAARRRPIPRRLPRRQRGHAAAVLLRGMLPCSAGDGRASLQGDVRRCDRDRMVRGAPHRSVDLRLRRECRESVPHRSLMRVVSNKALRADGLPWYTFSRRG